MEAAAAEQWEPVGDLPRRLSGFAHSNLLAVKHVYIQNTRRSAAKLSRKAADYAYS